MINAVSKLLDGDVGYIENIHVKFLQYQSGTQCTLIKNVKNGSQKGS